jgi:hypothetical protein
MDMYSITGHDYETNGTIPNINIPDKLTDKYIIWKKGMRLDTISYQYYGNPAYDFLIRHKNGEFGFDEYEWENGVEISIPFPLENTISSIRQEYEFFKQKNLI